MSHRKRLDAMLRDQDFSEFDSLSEKVHLYAEGLATLEKSIVVVSDLKHGKSRIFNGKFSETLGLSGYSNENSIWEKEILSKMTPEECEEKYLAELRFYNFLRQLPRQQRSQHYLATNLKFKDNRGKQIEVLHRMYYWYEDNSETIRFAICLYGPLIFGLPAKSVAVDTVTGKMSEISSSSDCSILSPREKQVLELIERGHTSRAIADELCISKNTVSRHRQEILAKLQARNSTEACRRAKQLKII